MAQHSFLPIHQSAALITSLATHTWPLREEDFRALAADADLTVKLLDTDAFSRAFTLNGSAHKGYLSRRSFGILQVYFHVSTDPELLSEASATPIANDYVEALITKLHPTLGTPTTYHDHGDDHHFAWWTTPQSVSIGIEYGTTTPTITILGPPQPEEPADTIVIPSVEHCVNTIRHWADTEWPLSVPIVHRMASEVGWSSEEESSTSFYSDIPIDMYQANPPYYSSDFYAEPDVYVRYCDDAAWHISFELAGYHSMRSQPQAFPAIRDRMKDVEAALRRIYGEPSPVSSAQLPFSAQWTLPNDVPFGAHPDSTVTLTLQYGRGKAQVTIQHPLTRAQGTYDGPHIYKVSHALEALTFWAELPHPLSTQEAFQHALDINWFPVDPAQPRDYYTPISAPARPGASIRSENGQVWLVTFDIARSSARSKYETHPHITAAMKEIEEALISDFGAPEVGRLRRVDYRDWAFPTGRHVRIAYGADKRSVWIYSADKRARIDALTAPMQTKDAPPTPKFKTTDGQLSQMRQSGLRVSKWHMVALLILAGVALSRIIMLLF